MHRRLGRRVELRRLRANVRRGPGLHRVSDDVAVGRLFAAGHSAPSCGGGTTTSTGDWFVTCGGQPQLFSLCRSDHIGILIRESAEYERTDGTNSYDPVLYLWSGETGGEVNCNDDGAATGATDCRGYDSSSDDDLVDGAEFGSRINVGSFPRGLGAIVVGSRSGMSDGTAGMDHRLLHRIQDAP